MDCLDYVRQISNKIGETKSDDRIFEDKWCLVMDEIKVISKERAKELAGELMVDGVAVWDKGAYKLGLDEAPPTRLLSLMLAVAPYVGRIMSQKRGDEPKDLLSSADCLKRIVEAYEWGVKSAKETPSL